ncbi:MULTISPECIES: DNA-directed RNA polymerase subunit omega [Jeotgalibacillus]|uniref:DNA-directed RNA polymerase subunit omega n=3 Tax=Jeotgalibacillus TaxID=157226 RepID=A0A0C2VNC2_9BACL|nr:MULTISPECIES: DNA-directed RNA polymerase subunit omega [Jeotgalibacillus]AJD90945.1 DNA-directed RNA polymerase subunit omega [Jeotgalibacillus malaysiensis]KIL50417.1 DNA-directed RNA polymerase subunit omega [Jeotgalibacillus alimentarius]MDZ5711600.1 DNA-directed RNA polymerase subunit omega [Jeotgalibacillus sp. HH7-29]
MLYPSSDALRKNIDSKYSLVSVAAKRARNMQEKGDKGSLESYHSVKFVGQALEEIAAGQLVMKKPQEGILYEDEK